MGQVLPLLSSQKLGPTRNRLQDAALILSNLQRAFLPKHPRQWDYGLEVNMRGLSTQVFTLAGEERRATLDLVKHKLRLEDRSWPLRDYDGPRLYAEVESWLHSLDSRIKLPAQKFSGSTAFDPAQATAYGEALWWLEEQFRGLKSALTGGVTSPILLYPHHFDLSLVWFPHDYERQVAVGFSTGDAAVTEPYLYLSAYPEPDGLKTINHPAEAHWQTDGFSGGVLPYAALAASDQPAELFDRFAAETFQAARPLLG